MLTLVIVVDTSSKQSDALSVSVPIDTQGVRRTGAPPSIQIKLCCIAFINICSTQNNTQFKMSLSVDGMDPSSPQSHLSLSHLNLKYHKQLIAKTQMPIHCEYLSTTQKVILTHLCICAGQPV